MMPQVRTLENGGNEGPAIMVDEQRLKAAVSAWDAWWQIHFIGTTTGGNTPVSVWRQNEDGTETRIFGPTHQIGEGGCEEWARCQAMTAALIAAEPAARGGEG